MIFGLHICVGWTAHFAIWTAQIGWTARLKYALRCVHNSRAGRGEPIESKYKIKMSNLNLLVFERGRRLSGLPYPQNTQG